VAIRPQEPDQGRGQLQPVLLHLEGGQTPWAGRCTSHVRGASSPGTLNRCTASMPWSRREPSSTRHVALFARVFGEWGVDPVIVDLAD
jgi:hypothetical protein